MVNLAIFASGGGSNAKAICAYFKAHPLIHVGLIVTNKSGAGVLNVAKDFDIPGTFIKKNQLDDSSYLLSLLEEYKIDYIILAGYLKLIPPWLIQSFPNKILNIHPSLLPKYGGKGMYGLNVHKAVKDHHERESGMTIHLVNEEFDKGEMLFQAKVPIKPHMSAQEIADLVLVLEHKHYSPTIEKFVLSSNATP